MNKIIIKNNKEIEVFDYKQLIKDLENNFYIEIQNYDNIKRNMDDLEYDYNNDEDLKKYIYNSSTFAIENLTNNDIKNIRENKTILITIVETFRTELKGILSNNNEDEILENIIELLKDFEKIEVIEIDE